MEIDVKIIQEAINSQPCSYCGKKHHVSLNVAGNRFSPFVTYDFSEDSCKEFQEAVKQFVSSKLITDTFPFPKGV